MPRRAQSSPNHDLSSTDRWLLRYLLEDAHGAVETPNLDAWRPLERAGLVVLYPAIGDLPNRVAATQAARTVQNGKTSKRSPKNSNSSTRGHRRTTPAERPSEAVSEVTP